MMKVNGIIVMILFLCINIGCNTFLVDRLPGSKEQLNKLKKLFYKLRIELIKFNTYFENRSAIYYYVKKVQYELKRIQFNVQKYQNIIKGNDNAIKGNENILVGGNNQISGSNNWVFRLAGYQGSMNKDLIFQRWKIQLDRKQLILIDPKLVITYLIPHKINLSKGSSKYSHKSRFRNPPVF